MNVQDGKPDSNNDRLTGTALVRAILANIHESLKWLWQVVMALAMVKAVEKYSLVLNIGNITTPIDLISLFANLYSVVFISFILIFIRFYFGDSRHLDLSYVELQYYHGLKKELEKYSGFKRLIDILLLLTHSIFFYFMALHIGSITNYLYFYSLLLFLDVVWLLSQYLPLQRISKNRNDEILIGDMNRYEPLLVWSINNLICLALILSVIFSKLEYREHIALLISLINSLFDFKFSWKFYFPDLKDIFEKS